MNLNKALNLELQFYGILNVINHQGYGKNWNFKVNCLVPAFFFHTFPAQGQPCGPQMEFC